MKFLFLFNKIMLRIWRKYSAVYLAGLLRYTKRIQPWWREAIKAYDMQNYIVQESSKEFERYVAHAQPSRETYINLMKTIDSNISIVCIDEFGKWVESKPEKYICSTRFL